MNFEKRIDEFAQCLTENTIEVAVLFNRANIRYFTGFRTNQVTNSILVIDCEGNVEYMVQLLDYQRAKKDCWISDDYIKHYPEDTPNYLEILKDPLVRLNPKTIGIEDNTISRHQTKYLEQICTETKFLGIDQMLLEQRAIKTDEELSLIKKAAAIADKGMTQALERVSAGTSEAEISAYAKYVMELEGAENPSFEPFVMSGQGAWLPQRISTRKLIEPGEIALFDMGARYEGYCSDITRTFCVGKPSKKQREIFDIAYRAQQEAIEAVKPGKPAGEIDKVAREIIEDAGYGRYFPHLTGHGLGLDIHELPIVDKGEEMVLKSNMVITIEPGIYAAGMGSARVEDMVVVTDSGYRVLTESKRHLLDL